MRAKKCDRCDKLYEHYDGSKEFKRVQKSSKIRKEPMPCFSLTVIWITNIGLVRALTSALIA